MPIGRYYVKGILVSEEEIDLERKDRQMRLGEAAPAGRGWPERADKR